MSKQKRVVRWARPDERVANKNITAKPGYKVFIANRGEVRLDFPEPWVINFGDDSIRITDKEPPDDDCTLQLSVHYLPPGIDWSGMPLKSLIESLDGKDDDPAERRTLGRGDIVEITRENLEIAWVEYRIVDVKQNREAISRLALARANDIQPLITFDFGRKTKSGSTRSGTRSCAHSKSARLVASNQYLPRRSRTINRTSPRMHQQTPSSTPSR